MSDKQKLLVIDGYALIFRAYYAFIKTTSFTTKSGEPTGAIFGFIRMIISALNKLKPDYVVVAWDSGGKTFRKNFIQNTKQIERNTADLKVQIPYIIDSINKFDFHHSLCQIT
jgi:DNA polymerase-1